MKLKRVLITGASSGIGEEFAKQLATQGVNLILAARRKDHLEALSHELSSKYKIEVEIFPVDLTEANAAERVFAFSTQDGKCVDGLINNAGVGQYRHFTDTALKDHFQAIDLNIRSLTELTYLFTKHMLSHKKESLILNVASTASFTPVPRYVVYSASKSYVKFFSENLNFELKGTNIFVSCLCPGGTRTEFLQNNNQVLKMENALMDVKDVVTQGLNGALKKKAVVVPGLLNRISQILSSIVPNSLGLRITEFAMKLAVKEQN